MKILLMSNDISLQTIFDNFGNLSNISKQTISRLSDPFEFLSEFYKLNPSVIIIDDDLLKPNSEKIIEALRKFSKKLIILFITSDSSLELGKKITPLGVYYYAIKPVTEKRFYELLEAINKTLTKKHINN